MIVFFLRKKGWALLFLVLPIFSFAQCPKDINVNFAIIQKDTAKIAFYISALENCEAMQDSLALLHNKLGGLIYKKRTKSAIEHTKKALVIWKKILPLDHIDIARSYYNLGIFYTYISEHKSAEIYFKEAAQVYEKRDANLEIYCYIRLGKIYRDIGDYNRGVQILELGIQKAKKAKKPKIQSKCYLISATILHEIKSYEKAIEYLKKAENFYKTQKSKKDLVACYRNFSRSYYELKNYKKAIFYSKKEIAVRGNDKNPFKKIAALNNLGLYYLRAKDIQKAKSALNESLKLADLHNLPSSKAIVYDNLGEVELDLKQHTKALGYFHKAVILSVKSFSNPDYISTPSEAQIKKTIEKQNLLVYLGDKAKTSLLVYNDTKENKYLTSCLETYIRCNYLIDLMRQEHTDQNSKLFWREKVMPIYEKAIEASYVAQDYERAFFFFEKSRAVLLLDAMLNAEALNALQNDSLIQQKKQLNKALLSAQELVENGNENERNEALGKVMQLNNEFDALIRQIGKDYPNYHAIKHETAVISTIDVINGQLKDGKTALLHYFLGEEKSWLYVLSDKKTMVKELGTAQKTRKLVAKYVSYFENASKIINDPQGYGKAAFELQEYLIAPAELAEIEDLIIIPDGILGFVPFESLVTKYDEEINPAKMQYLIKDYSIRLSFSATILGKQNQCSSAQEGLLAFAPFSDKKSEGKYPALPFSEDELFAIEKSIAGRYFKGNKASKAQFLNQAADFSVVHLSTHAAANEAGSQPFILFSDSILTLRELYGLNLPTNLVVLSACETNVGEVKSGEGVFSLSRGFAYAGAKSIIASLWNVNASSTGEIFPVFYENLKEGNLKSNALRKAKLKYINAPSAIGQIKTPYDWAGFVLIGNNENIALASPSNNMIIWGVLLGIILLVLIKKFKS